MNIKSYFSKSNTTIIKIGVSILLLFFFLWIVNFSYPSGNFYYIINGETAQNYLKTDGYINFNEEFSILTLNHNKEENSKIEIADQNLKEGEYTLRMYYSTSGDNDSISVSSKQSSGVESFGDDYLIDINLDKDEEFLEVSFIIEKDIFDGVLNINTSSEEFVFSRLELSSQTVKVNDKYFIMGLVVVFYIFVMCILFKRKPFKDSKLFFSSDLNAKREYFAFFITFICITIILTAPLLQSYLPVGVDFEFHISRIVGLESALNSSQFPVRVHGELLNGYGYANGMFYPEILFYPLAILYHFDVSLMIIYQVFVFLVQFFTLVIAFIMFTKLFKNKYAGFFTALVYLTSVYRLTALFAVSAMGEITAMMFIPIAIYGMYETVFSQKKNWIYLAVGMCLVVQTHILTAVSTTVICAAIALVGIKNVFGKEKRIIPLLKATCTAIFLNIWFIVPLLFTSSQLNFIVYNRFYTLGSSLSFMQLLDTAIISRANTGIGYIFLIGLFLYVLYLVLNPIKNEKIQKIGVFSFIVGIIFVLSNTKYFPWFLIYKIPLLPNILSSFQGTFRFMLPASVLLSILCGVVFILYTDKLKNKKYITSILSILIIIITLNSFVSQDDYAARVYPSKFLLTVPTSTVACIGQGEYLLEGTSLQMMMEDRGYVISENSDFEINDIKREGTNLSFNYIIPENLGEQSVLIPLSYYPGYKAVVNGEEIAVNISGNNQINLILPTGEGEVSVYYSSLTVFRIAEIISFITLIAMISYRYTPFYKKYN